MKHYLEETFALGRLAGPLVLASLVSMSISITDVIMMGWLGNTALAAGAATSDFYSIFHYLLAGVVAAVSPLVSQARGAGQFDSIGRITRQGYWLALKLGLLGAVIVWHTAVFLRLIGVDAQIAATAQPYAQMMAITFVPMMGVMVCHHYLSAHGRTNILLRAAALSLPLNGVGNYLLMFGHHGLPEMGLAGAGLSSALAGLFMLAFMLAHVIRDATTRGYELFAGLFQFDRAAAVEILRVGIPIGVLTLGEVGIVLLSTVVMGVFGIEALAAHAVALRCAGVIYAVPLGLAQAATIRIAYAVGANNHHVMMHTANTAIGLALLVGTGYAIGFGIWSADIAALFLGKNSPTPAVLIQATLFLTIIACYQPFQCLGTVSTGVLRGVKDTRVPMLLSLASYWGTGGVAALVLVHLFELDALGIWLGLAGGATSYGLAMSARFSMRWRTMENRQAGYLIDR